MAHESAIPLDAGMWLDDERMSLEKSLHAPDTGDALAFDDDEVHTLFPMLSEASFDYDDENKLADRKDDTQIEGAFSKDPSPVRKVGLTPKTPEPKIKPSKSPKRNTPQQWNSLSTPQKSPSASRRSSSVGPVIPFPYLEVAAASTPRGTRNRKRRLRSTSLTTTLTQWTDHEQNVFFMVFKPKWRISCPSAEEFADLLLERFDAVSEKLKTSQKTSHDAEAFYNAIVRGITDLLDTAMPHDIDLLNPDEIRIALWCWHKLMDDSDKRRIVEKIDDAPDSEKKVLGHDLLQSIIRSRRQMLKARGSVNTSSLTIPSAPILDSTEEIESLEGLLREALEHSSLPSYLYQLAPVADNAAPVVHHPLVRKKSLKTPTTPLGSSKSGGSKRERSESVELHHAFTSGTPIGAHLTSSGDYTAPTPSFFTPPLSKPTKKPKIENHSQTPLQSSRKKIYIKLRMVPRDSQTKDLVERSGCNPKVELKLSSTKTISDVLDHMAKKWASVLDLVGKNQTLHFFQKEGLSGSPIRARDGYKVQYWSRKTCNVTCLDLWKQIGKTKNDEHIAVVSYQWCVDENAVSASESSLPVWMEDPAPLLDLLDEGDAPETRRYLAFDHDECSSRENSPFPINSGEEIRESSTESTARVQPIGRSTVAKQSLQEFGETVAFDTKSILQTDLQQTGEHLSLDSLPEEALNELIEYSPDSQRMRRRITPVLVSTNECQL